MIVFKEDFKFNYVEKLKHKVLRELDEKLPEKGFFSEMIVEANKIVNNITREEI